MTRYRVRDQEKLRERMRKSERIVPHSVRSLADLVGKSRSQIGFLLTGDRPVIDEETAQGVASALKCDVDDLFLPESSQSRDGNNEAPHE